MNSRNAFKPNYLLAPLALLYRIATGVRNTLFSSGLLPSVEFSLPVICVGNIAACGTGKTPHTEYLIDLLTGKYRVAMVCRGYMRKTKGFVMADDTSTAATIGDEAFQIKLKYPSLTVAVDANRRRAINTLLAMPDKPEVILLDDAFQHRYVQPSLSLLLTDYNRPFHKDMLLPLGLLRESVNARFRADAVIVTKCEGNLRPIDYRIIESKMRLNSNQHIFFTKILYQPLRPAFPNPGAASANFTLSDTEVLLLTGIAAPAPLIEKVKTMFCNVTVMTFPDHHDFNHNDFVRINEAFARLSSPEKFIITTEKDAARLKHNQLLPQQLRECVYVLPVRMEFCNESSLRFDEWVMNHVTDFKNKNIYNVKR